MRSAACPSHSGGGSRTPAGAPRAAPGSRRSAPGRGRAACWCRRDRHRPLGVVAQREAGHAEVGRLLLDPAGVGEHGAGVGLEREEVEVADRVDQLHARRHRSQPVAEHLPGPRVDREEHRHLAADRGQRAPSRRPAAAPSTSAGPVQRDEQVGAGLEPVLGRGPPCRGTAPRARRACRSSCCRRSWIRSAAIPSRARFVVASGGVREEQVGELVGEDPVDLLRHRPVEAAQPRLDVARSGSAASRRTSAAARVELTSPGTITSSGRSSISIGSSASSTRASISAWRARADAEHVVGLGNAELLEEDPRHQLGRSAGRCGRARGGRPGARAQRRDHRRHLDEVRARPDDVDEAHRRRLFSPRMGSGERVDPLRRARSRPRSGRPRSAW